MAEDSTATPSAVLICRVSPLQVPPGHSEPPPLAVTSQPLPARLTVKSSAPEELYTAVPSSTNSKEPRGRKRLRLADARWTRRSFMAHPPVSTVPG